MSLPTVIVSEDVPRDVIVVAAVWEVGWVRGEAAVEVTHQFLSAIYDPPEVVLRWGAREVVRPVERQVSERMLPRGGA